MDVVTASSPLLKSFLAGTVSGTCSTLLFQPLDLLKTRQQASVQKGVRKKNVLKIIRKVLQKETITGFWRGVTPSIARCVPGVGVYFCSLHWLTTEFTSGNASPVEAMFLGALARSFSGVILLPFTVIKTRFESGEYNYRGVSQALRSIYVSEGARGLYCGLIPTLVRDAPFSGIYLLFYTSMKNVVPQGWKEGHSAPPTYFCCGMVSGLLAAMATQPADVIKTQIQLYPYRFHNIPDVVSHLYKEHGIRVFYTGIVPRLLRRTLMTAMAWTVYEQMTVKLKLK